MRWQCLDCGSITWDIEMPAACAACGGTGMAPEHNDVYEPDEAYDDFEADPGVPWEAWLLEGMHWERVHAR